MHLLVVPDIHHCPNTHEIEEAIAREAPTEVVFLGDYFDQWNDAPDDAARTAAWLKRSLSERGRTHLWGNHDLAYGFPSARQAACPGYTVQKLEAIERILQPEHWARLRFWHRSGDILCTHSGFSCSHLPSGLQSRPEFDRFLDQASDTALQRLAQDEPHWVTARGAVRGGAAPCGGLVWCDVHEFVPIPGLHQIFGHTPGHLGTVLPGEGSVNVCLDTTDPSGLKHYALVTEREIQIRTIGGERVKVIPLNPAAVNQSARRA